MTVRLFIDFEAAGQASGDLARMRSELQGLHTDLADTTQAGDRTTGSMDGMKTAATALAVGVAAVTAAAGAAAVAIARVAAASIEGEKDFTRLDNALRGAGAAFDSSDEQLQAFFNQLQSTTRFAGGEAAQAMAIITRRARDFNLSQQELAEVTRVSADVAEQLGISLEAAGERVVKALEGESRALRELGVEGENADDIFEALQERFAGAAESIDPLEQATARLTNAYDDLVRVAGRYITQNEALQNSVRNAAIVVEVLTSVLDQNNESTAELRALLAQIIPSFDSAGASAEFFARVVGVLVRGLAIGINTFRAFEMALVAARITGAGLATGLATLATIINEGLTRAVTLGLEQLGRLAEGFAAVAGFIPGMGGIEQAAQRAADAIGAASQNTRAFADEMRTMRRDVQDAFAETAREGTARIAELANAMAETDEAARRFADAFREAVREAGDAVEAPEVMARVRVSLAREGDDEAAAVGERIAETVDRAREQKERELARDRERRARELSAAIARIEQERNRLLLNLMDEEERRADILYRAREAFAVDGWSAEIDVAQESAAILEELRKTQDEREREALEQRLFLLRQFSEAQREIAAENAAIETERQRALERQAAETARRITQASAAAGAAIGRIFAGADPGEEFARLALQQVGKLITGIGEAAILEGAIMSIPGPSFSPFGAAKIAAGVVAVGFGTGLGAAASGVGTSTPAASAAPAPPEPVSFGNGAGGGPIEQVNQYNDFGPFRDPYAAAREQKRAMEAGARGGFNQGAA